MRETLIDLAYLIASVCFILALKGLARPRTALHANLVGAAGMLLAVVATLAHRQIVDVPMIALGSAIGTLAGIVLALKVAMTAMPQMVAVLNGLGGAASVLVAGAAWDEAQVLGQALSPDAALTAVASVIVGAVTFTGSVVAWAKLEETFRGRWSFRGLQALNLLLFLASLGLGVLLLREPGSLVWYWGLAGVSCILGVFLVAPIGGADMPVVIALLNSYSGVAAALTGFVLDNAVLIIAGALVGASGIILTKVMCRAMNRSLLHVLLGRMGGASSVVASADAVYQGKVKETTADEVALLLVDAKKVVIVPGYGLAVAQGQHAVRELANQLEQRGTQVYYAIHPVAGRMPGHMNVLLAEADIPYDQMKEMDQINPEFPEVDVTLVVGANDVVNPSARTDPQSPLAGMPILDVDRSRTVVVLKRSLSPGFAGIPNPLFAAPNCLMLFADAKKGLFDLAAALKEA